MSFFEEDRKVRRPFYDRDVTDLPMVTILSIVTCVSFFWAFGQNDSTSIPNELEKVWFQNPEDIWKGGYWSLVTSAFVHFKFFHILFNVYWLWIFGATIEKAIGSAKFLVFVILAAFVSSSYQVALSGNAGVGFLGVNYAFFGFMWISRFFFASFRGVLNDGVIRLMFIWLFLCILLDKMGIMPIANVAHFTGFIFGCGVGAIFVLFYKRKLVVPAFAVFLAGSVLTLFWAPWLLNWSAMKAYDAHSAGKFEEAMGHYNRIIRWHPTNRWAIFNREILREEMEEK
ncbi:rhomboid family intramembrane serine protease [Verrucomicrobiaceae bacterium 227]